MSLLNTNRRTSNETYDESGDLTVADSDVRMENEDDEVEDRRKVGKRLRFPQDTDVKMVEPSSERMISPRDRSPTPTPHPLGLSKKEERELFNRSPSSSSSPPPAQSPPRSSSNLPISTFKKFELKAALQRQQAAASASAASSSVASSSKRPHPSSAATSSSRTSASLPPSSKPRPSQPTSSRPSKLKPTSSSAPKPASSALGKSSSSKDRFVVVVGGLSFTKTLADRPSVFIGRTIRVTGSNAVRFVEREAWDAFSQFGHLEVLDVLVTSQSIGTKVVLVTYILQKSADDALGTINSDDFPVGQPRMQLWTNLSNRKPRLEAFRVEAKVFGTHVERWLKSGGVISYTPTGTKTIDAASSSSDEDSSDSSSASDSDSDHVPPPKKVKRTVVASRSSSEIVEDDDFVPATIPRIPRDSTAETSKEDQEKGKQREIIDLVSSDVESKNEQPKPEEVTKKLNKMSLEQAPKIKNATPLDASMKEVSDDDSSSERDTESDTRGIADLFNDLIVPVSRPSGAFVRSSEPAIWKPTSASSSSKLPAVDLPSARDPSPEVVDAGSDSDGGLANDEHEKQAEEDEEMEKDDWEAQGTQKPAFQCTLCRRRFDDADALRSHQLSSHSNRFKQCWSCPRVLPVSKIKKHVKHHRRSALAFCTICEEGYTKSAQTSHHRTHHRGVNASKKWRFN